LSCRIAAPGGGSPAIAGRPAGQTTKRPDA
jgi:hypothetical protein